MLLVATPSATRRKRPMPIEMKRAYLEAIKERYSKSTKKQKGQILKEFCEVCGYSRKYAIRILRGRVKAAGLNKPGPKAKYDQVVVHHLSILWESMNKMCSKKMKAAIPLWLPFYKDIDQRSHDLLLRVSASTIDRLLKPYRDPRLRGISTTSPSFVKHRIPIELLDGEITEPGHMESDTVAHCGDSASGTFVNSLTMTDLLSGWTVNRAIWGKSAENTLDEIKIAEAQLPFKMQGFACDNGTEFLNEALLEYLTEQKKDPVKFVRRRPYKKNDAAHVEQKNFTHVRELFGYDRFDHQGLVTLMNEIYQAFWNPLLNYFTPVMKLTQKTRVGSKTKKKYDQPKTPYQRLLEAGSLTEQQKGRLREAYQGKNPFFLKKELDRRLKIFFGIVEMHRREAKMANPAQVS